VLVFIEKFAEFESGQNPTKRSQSEPNFSDSIRCLFYPHELKFFIGFKYWDKWLKYLECAQNFCFGAIWNLAL